MVKVILGLKGSGKTKRLVEMVTRAIGEESGDVIVIEKERKLIYDIPHKARLINTDEYKFRSAIFFKGFISGLYAGNYDITHVFIDNFLKILKGSPEAEIGKLLEWLDEFGSSRGVKFTVSISVDPDTAPEFYCKYI